MSRTLLATVTSGLLALHAGAALACDAATVATSLERARRAEDAHALGAAIELRAQLLACPPGAHTVANQLALARDHASLGGFARAAELLEALSAERAPDALLIGAMGEAVGYRVALREVVRAKDDVAWLLAATGPSEGTLERAFGVGLAFEEARMWTEATQWYQHLATRFSSREQWRVQVRAMTGLARAYEALGDLASATRHREAVLARWPTARPSFGPDYRDVTFERVRIPPWRPPPRQRLEGGGARGAVSHFGGMTEAGVDNQNANGRMESDDPYLSCFAEAQFQLAWQAELAFLRAEMPRYTGPPSRAAYYRWAADVLAPWVTYRMQHLNETFTASFTRVIEVHVPRWEITASYALAHGFMRFACEIRMASLPPYINPAGLDRWGRPPPTQCEE